MREAGSPIYLIVNLIDRQVAGLYRSESGQLFFVRELQIRAVGAGRDRWCRRPVRSSLRKSCLESRSGREQWGLTGRVRNHTIELGPYSATQNARQIEPALPGASRAMGYPASAWRMTPVAGSFQRTRSSRFAAAGCRRRRSPCRRAASSPCRHRRRDAATPRSRPRHSSARRLTSASPIRRRNRLSSPRFRDWARRPSRHRGGRVR